MFFVHGEVNRTDGEMIPADHELAAELYRIGGRRAALRCARHYRSVREPLKTLTTGAQHTPSGHKKVEGTHRIFSRS